MAAFSCRSGNPVLPVSLCTIAVLLMVASWFLCCRHGDQSWKRLKRDLGSADTETRGNALRVISNLTQRSPPQKSGLACRVFGFSDDPFNSERVASDLIGSLADSHHDVRISAALILAKTKNKEAVGPLISALEKVSSLPDRTSDWEGSEIEIISWSLSEITGLGFGVDAAAWKKWFSTRT